MKINENPTLKKNQDFQNYLFSEYMPYKKSDLKITKFESAKYDAERINMVTKVNDILGNVSVEQYKNGLNPAVKKIKEVIDENKISFANLSVLEFGAGICKTSAVISKYHNIKEIVCVDIAENLLTEVAPRVISLIGGHLNKTEFLIGDMNEVFNLKRKFDAIVCYGAVHHLHLPEYFFEQIQNILNEGGFILILDEPTLPSTGILPFTGGSKYVKNHYEKRFHGVNENIYTINQYKKIFGSNWNTKILYKNFFHKLKPFRPWSIFMSDFLLTRN